MLKCNQYNYLQRLYPGFQSKTKPQASYGGNDRCIADEGSSKDFFLMMGFLMGVSLKDESAGSLGIDLIRFDIDSASC